MATKLDDNILDILVSNIASDCMKRVQEAAPNLTDAQRIEYLGRTLAEILAAIVTAAPPDEILNVTNNICGMLQSMVKRSPQVIMGMKSSLQERFEDILYMSKPINNLKN